MAKLQEDISKGAQSPSNNPSSMAKLEDDSSKGSPQIFAHAIAIHAQPQSPSADPSPLSKPEEESSKVKERSRLCTAFQFGLVFLFVVGLIGMVIWLIYTPYKMEVYVESASLTRFDLATSNHTLYYNLTLGIGVRNPSKKISLDYDGVAAGAFYDGKRFGYVDLPSFQEDKNSTVMLNPAFQGQAPMGSGDSAVVKFKREKGEGNFDIDAKIYFKVKYKAGFARSQAFVPAVDCPLSVPAANSTNGFTRTKCDVILP